MRGWVRRTPVERLKISFPGLLTFPVFMRIRLQQRHFVSLTAEHHWQGSMPETQGYPQAVLQTSQKMLGDLSYVSVPT